MASNVEIIKANQSVVRRNDRNTADRLRVAAYCRVSTNDEEQINSYQSQMQHYTDLIKQSSEWAFAGIYADEAITGTQVNKREDFLRLMNDCMNGEIDMVITKSISRFARNTLDTLKYVRMLKDKQIAVLFEDEKINTLTMDGELLLVVLSSVAQQEVENISANVKKGLKMKMQRGEMVGFQGCLGYDYHPDTKTITINEEEAEIVRYIFRRYIEGAGGKVISRELRNLGYKTKRGNLQWPESTVLGIIKNEKYMGDVLQGKTFTVDPISKRRLNNLGEEDMFYIRDHHEPIVTAEDFEKAKHILARRTDCRTKGVAGRRDKFSRQYSFSCMIECGFCFSNLSRRRWHSGSKYGTTMWQCVAATKKGKKYCPDSKGIAEETIEKAFLESYRILVLEKHDILDELLERTEAGLRNSEVQSKMHKIDKEIDSITFKRTKLVDMRLEQTIDKETYESKFIELSAKIKLLEDEYAELNDAANTEANIKRRIEDFRSALNNNRIMEEFDRSIFESLVEKVIVGGYDTDGNKAPMQITFVYKTGLRNQLDSTRLKPDRINKSKNPKRSKLCSQGGLEEAEKYSSTEVATCGDYMLDVKC